MNFLAIGLLWIGTAARIWTTLSNRSVADIRPGRKYFTAGLILVAASFTVRLAGEQVDQLTGQPNLGELIWHLLLVAAGPCVFAYLRVQRGNNGQAPTRTAGPFQWLIASALAVTLVVLWIRAPVHVEHYTDMLQKIRHSPWTLRLYVILFEPHLFAWTAAIAFRSTATAAKILRLPAQEELAPDGRRQLLIAQVLMALGAALAALAALVTLVRAAAAAALTETIEKSLLTINVAAGYSAAVLVSVGVAVPVAVNVRSVFLELQELRPLWAALTARNAHLQFNVDNSSDSVRRRRRVPVRILTARRRDIRDSLSHIRIHAAAGATIVAITDPLLRENRLGRTLASGDVWKLISEVSDAYGTIARDLIEPVTTRHEERAQLLRIAAGYNAQQHLNAPGVHG